MSWKRVQIPSGDDVIIGRQWVRRSLIGWRWQDIENGFNELYSELRRLRSRLRAGNCAVQQSDTSAFGVKHIPYEMLFTAMIIWLSCNLHGGSSLRGGAPAPSDWRATSFGRLVESIVAQWIQVIRAAHRVVRSLEGWLESAGECASGEVFLPIKLLLMPLAISIAFAIMHYRIAGYL